MVESLMQIYEEYERACNAFKERLAAMDEDYHSFADIGIETEGVTGAGSSLPSIVLRRIWVRSLLPRA